MPNRPRYAFRSVEPDDLPTLRAWLNQPHVREWWGDPEKGIAEIEAAMDDISTEPLIVKLDGKPVAYLQSYDPHLEDDHPYADQPMGTLGLDISIGAADLIGKGHGSAIIAQFAEELFAEGAPRLVIDPHPDNARAIRAYEKAGFRHIDTRNSLYGPAHLMALDAPQDTENS